MTAEPAVRLTSLLQIAVRVRDMDRAIAFYRDTLGVPFMFRAGNLAAFYLDGVRLMLDIPDPAMICIIRATRFGLLFFLQI